MPKIEIIAGGIYGQDGEVAIGSVHHVASVPAGWADRVRVLADDPVDAVALTNDDKAALIAEIEALGGKADRRKSVETLAAELAALKG